ncbi:GGDEF domain-containing protein [Pseudobacillus wudalianchiensis]|uniref:GGDEF domain-containing protein n=1 Tax=Pseudobacillus wudalianchiensis TaxID=1743143 RepID=UPI00159F2C30|nr:GGDEF domain-containing protein [Bacillus wudalianchiensis]
MGRKQDFLRMINSKLEDVLRRIVKTFHRVDFKENEDFVKSNTILLMHRLKITSIILLVLYAYYLYVDTVLFKDLKDASYRYTLIAVHLAGFLLSIFYLCFYRMIKNKESFLTSKGLAFITNTYVLFYVLMGVIASLNSQRLTGNVDAYAIIIISVAAILPIRPTPTFFIFLFSHIAFLLGLSIVSEDKYIVITKQINTTVAAMIAFFIVVTLYSNRRKDFMNEVKIKKNEESFRKLFDVNPYPLILTTIHDGKIVLMNQRAKDFYQQVFEQKEQVDGTLIYNDLEERLTIVKNLIKYGSIKNHIIEQKAAFNSARWLSVNYELIDYANEKHILVGITDITNFKEVENELRKHASVDMLTGIINRRSGMEILQNACLNAQNQYMEFILCFIDINNLKEVNDRHGHSEGDNLIKTVCGEITKHIEKEDVFFRYGGDEFIIVFFNKQMSDVHKIWDTIMNAFEEMKRLQNKPYNISVSYGCYYYKTGTNVSVEEAVELADIEMYKEKSKSKQNKYSI